MEKTRVFQRLPTAQKRRWIGLFGLLLIIGGVCSIASFWPGASTVPSPASSARAGTNKNQTTAVPVKETAFYLTNQQLAGSYPSTWQQAVITETNQTDSLVLTAPSNLMLDIQTGISSQTPLGTILAASPITVLGQASYEVFYNSHSAADGLADGACISTTPNGTVFAAAPATTSTTGHFTQICLSYPQDEAGNQIQNTVAAFQADPDYLPLLGVIKSLHYQTE